MNEQEPETKPTKQVQGLDALDENHSDSIIESDNGPGVAFADLEESRPDVVKKSDDRPNYETKESKGRSQS